MFESMKGKVCLVTGAGKGIGAATAKVFAKHGVKVVVNSRSVETGTMTTEEIKASGGEATFFQADVGKEDEVKALVKFVIETYGALDYAINNAGFESPNALVHETSFEDWKRVNAVNYDGVFLCLKYELEYMVKQQAGKIINMGSECSYSAVPYMSPYASSKHGVLGLTRTAAAEYAGMGIRINAICPGTVMTSGLQAFFEARPGIREELEAQTPTRTICEPEEIANLALFLCSDAVDSIAGAGVIIDGGKNVL